MAITRIALENFRSFRRAELRDLCPGINLVLGANGAGKSNVYEALSWAADPRRLHSSEAERQSSLNSASGALEASVTLAFDNSGGRLSGYPAGEVQLRRVFSLRRDALYINGKAASRAEAEALLDALGCGSPFSIIRQNTVQEISRKSPANLFAAVKAAAGVEEYLEKRQRAQARLEEAVGKREAAQAKIEQARARLAELEQQRQEFVVYREVEEEGRAAELLLLRLERADLLKEREAAERAAEGLRGELGEARTACAAAEAEIDRRAAATRAAQQRVLDCAEARARVVGGLAAFSRLLEEYRYRASDPDASSGPRPARGPDSAAEGGEEGEGLRELVSSASARLSALQVEQERRSLLAAGVARRAAGAGANADPNSPEGGEEAALLAATRAGLQQREAALGVAREELRAAEQAAAVLDRTVAERRAALRALRGSLASSPRRALELELQRLRGEYVAKQAETSALARRVSEAKFQHTIAEDELYSTAPGSLGSVLRIVRDLCERDAALRARVHGAVIELFSCAPELYYAVEAAAGASTLFTIVVDTPETAMTLIRLIRDSRGRGAARSASLGKVSILPLATIAERGGREAQLEEGAVPISSLVRPVDQRFSAVVSHVFRNSMLCRSLDQAMQVSQRLDVDCYTVEGDSVLSSGMASGGFRRSSRMRLAKALRDARDGLRRLGEQQAALAAACRACEGGIREKEAGMRDAASSAEGVEAQISAAESELQEAERGRQEAGRAATSAADRVAEAEKARDKARQSLAALTGDGLEMGASSATFRHLSDQQLRDEVFLAEKDLAVARMRLRASEEAARSRAASRSAESSPSPLSQGATQTGPRGPQDEELVALGQQMIGLAAPLLAVGLGEGGRGEAEGDANGDTNGGANGGANGDADEDIGVLPQGGTPARPVASQTASQTASQAAAASASQDSPATPDLARLDPAAAGLRDFTALSAKLASRKTRIDRQASALDQQLYEANMGLEAAREAYDERRRALDALERRYAVALAQLQDLDSRGADMAQAEVAAGAVPEEKLEALGRTLDSRIKIALYASAQKAKLAHISGVNQRAIDQFLLLQGELNVLEKKLDDVVRGERGIRRLMARLAKRFGGALAATLEDTRALFKRLFACALGLDDAAIEESAQASSQAASQAARASQEVPEPSEVKRGFADLIVPADDPGKASELFIVAAFEDHLPLSAEELSGGQLAVVSLCFALALQGAAGCQFLVLDEVDAALDAGFRRSLARLLKRVSSGELRGRGAAREGFGGEAGEESSEETSEEAGEEAHGTPSGAGGGSGSPEGPGSHETRDDDAVGSADPAVGQEDAPPAKRPRRTRRGPRPPEKAGVQIIVTSFREEIVEAGERFYAVEMIDGASGVRSLPPQAALPLLRGILAED